MNYLNSGGSRTSKKKKGGGGATLMGNFQNNCFGARVLHLKKLHFCFFSNMCDNLSNGYTIRTSNIMCLFPISLTITNTISCFQAGGKKRGK